jgi:hypothetical protein
MEEKDIRYTANGINLENRIKKGLTKFFEIEQSDQASEYADQKGSYREDCYTVDENGKREFVGYYIPS